MEELLEKIRKYFGYFYISDLHSSIEKKQVLEFIETIAIEQYSLEDWSLVCSYIFENKKIVHQFVTYNDLIHYLSN